jgi:hypothetical protein
VRAECAGTRGSVGCSTSTREPRKSRVGRFGSAMGQNALRFA